MPTPMKFGTTLTITGYTATDYALMVRSAKSLGMSAIRIDVTFKTAAPLGGTKDQAYWDALLAAGSLTSGLDWTAADAAVNAIYDGGLEPHILLAYGTDWLPRPITVVGGAAKDTENSTNLNKFAKAFGLFCYAVADRYKTKCANYEIWNEPSLFTSGSSQGFWDWSDVGFRQVLAEAAYQVHRGDSACKVSFDVHNPDKLANYGAGATSIFAGRMLKIDDGGGDNKYTLQYDSSKTNIRPIDYVDAVYAHAYPDRGNDTPENMFDWTKVPPDDLWRRLVPFNQWLLSVWGPGTTGNGQTGAGQNVATRGTKRFGVNEVGWYSRPRWVTTTLAGNWVTPRKQAAMAARAMLLAMPHAATANATGLLDYYMTYNLADLAASTTITDADKEFNYGLFEYKIDNNAAANLSTSGELLKEKPAATVLRNLWAMLGQADYTAAQNQLISSRRVFVQRYVNSTSGMRFWAVWSPDNAAPVGDVSTSVVTTVSLPVDASTAYQYNLEDSTFAELTISSGAVSLSNIGEMPILVVERNGGRPFVAAISGNTHVTSLPAANVDAIAGGDGIMATNSLYLKGGRSYSFNGGYGWDAPLYKAMANDTQKEDTGAFVEHMTKIVSIEGGNHLGLTSDGTVWYHGPKNGNLWQGRTGSYDNYSGTWGWIQVYKSAGVFITDATDIALVPGTLMYLDSTGQVWYWGGITVTSPPSGTTGVASDYPTKLKKTSTTDFNGVAKIAGGNDFDSPAMYTFAFLMTDGKVYTYGSYRLGQAAIGALGNYWDYMDYPQQARISNTPTYITGAIAIEVNGGNLMVLDTAGKVWVAGNNSEGQLGDSGNTAATGSVLTKVKASGGADLLGITEIAMRMTGNGHNTMFALKNDGNVYAWGCNRGQGLGDGSTLDTTFGVVHATPVVAMHNVPTAVAHLAACGVIGSPQYITAYGGATILRETGGSGSAITL